MDLQRRVAEVHGGRRADTAELEGGVEDAPLLAVAPLDGFLGAVGGRARGPRAGGVQLHPAGIAGALPVAPVNRLGGALERDAPRKLGHRLPAHDQPGEVACFLRPVGLARLRGLRRRGEVREQTIEIARVVWIVTAAPRAPRPVEVAVLTRLPCHWSGSAAALEPTSKAAASPRFAAACGHGPAGSADPALVIAFEVGPVEFADGFVLIARVLQGFFLGILARRVRCPVGWLILRG